MFRRAATQAMVRHFAAGLALSVVTVACTSTGTNEQSQAVDLRFADVANEVGLDFRHGAFRWGISADPAAMMGELFGRASGACKGKGGSMHIADFSIGMLGANGIVAAGIPIAVGAAQGIKLKGEAAIVACFFGDGAVNRGPFLEGLNWAAVYRLPVLFVCEDNGFAAFTRGAATTAGYGAAARAESIGLRAESVDGNEAQGVTSCTVDASFNSIADTWADESKLNNTFGTNTVMLVRSWQSAKDGRSFVEFDVSSIPAGSTINTATLTLCATKVPSSTRTIDLHRITASWVETTLNWSNQPGVAGSVTDSATTPGSPACMTWDVAADVQLWIYGTANEGWRAKDSVEGQGTKYITEFATRENGTPADRHILDVNYTP